MVQKQAKMSYIAVYNWELAELRAIVQFPKEATHFLRIATFRRRLCVKDLDLQQLWFVYAVTVIQSNFGCHVQSL